MKNQDLKKSIRDMLESETHDEIVQWLKSQTAITSLQHLYGVAERQDYHPEKDSGVHLEMCMEQAWRWCESAEERAAVLLHDIGKAVTGRAIPDPTGIGISDIKYDEQGDVIPTHAGHDLIGAAMMPGVFADLGLPQEWLPLAVTVARRHQQLHGVLKFQSNSVVQFVLDVSDEINTKTREDAVGAFTRCVRADFNGRLGFESLNYVQGDMLIVAERAMTEFEEMAQERDLVVRGIEEKRDELFKKVEKNSPEFSLEKTWMTTMAELRELQKSGLVPVSPPGLQAFVGLKLAQFKESNSAYVPQKLKMR